MRRTTKITAIGGVALASVLALAACGGGGAETVQSALRNVPRYSVTTNTAGTTPSVATAIEVVSEVPGSTLLADARQAFANAGCNVPPLPRPGSRVQVVIGDSKWATGEQGTAGGVTGVGAAVNYQAANSLWYSVVFPALVQNGRFIGVVDPGAGGGVVHSKTYSRLAALNAPVCTLEK